MNPNESETKVVSVRNPTDWKNVLGILGIFAGGLVLGVVSQHLNRGHGKPPGPAPFAGMEKFHDGNRGPEQGQGPGFGPGRPDDRPRMSRGNDRDGEGGPRFGQNRPEPSPEMKEYADKVRGVVEPYKTKIEAVLTAEQKEKMAAHNGGPGERRKEGPQGPEANRGPEDRQGGGPRGRDPLMGIVIYKATLERMTEHLGLNDKQKAQVEKIMAEQRDALLKFVDQNPPPSPERKHNKEA